MSVVGGADQPGIDVFLPVGTGLAGTVRRADTNAPLAGAVVQVYDAATDTFILGPDPSGNNGMTTNGSGQYDSGLVLPPGDYKVRAHAPGFQDRFHVSAADFGGATPVTTTTGSVPGIDVTLPPNPPPPLTLRDTFEGTTLDPTLWAESNLDIVRQISGGKVDLSLKAVNANLNNNLRFANETVDPFSNFSIQADVALTAVDLAGMQTRARINFGLFNVNGGAPVPGDNTGDVSVEFAVSHSGSALRVYIDVFRCDDAPCNNAVDLFFTTSAFDPGPLGSSHTMSVTWTAGTKTLTFGFDGQPPVSFTIPPAYPVARAVNIPFSNLSLRVRSATGGPAGKSGSASATFDNVVVDGIPYDDFAAGSIDPAKWKDLELVRQVGGGVFTSSVRRIGFNGGNNMNLANANSVTAMQADVTLAAATSVSASPQARLVGGFYNNGTGTPGNQTGDVLAGIGLARSGGGFERGFFFVSRCTTNNCNVPGEYVTLASGDNIFGTFDPGESHRLSLQWDPVGHVFTFGFDGVTHTVAPTGFPGFAVVNAVPHVAFKAIGTRVDSIAVPPAPGEGGSVTATFDNFFAGNFISGRVTTGNGVSPLADANVTAYASGSPVATVVSGADGTYTIPDLPDDTYQVGATAAGFISRFFRGKTTLGSANLVVIAPGGARVGVNLPLTVAGAGTESSYGLDTPPPLVVVPTAGVSTGQQMGPVQIAENGVGALTAGGTIMLSLPAGVTFNTRPNVSTIVGNELQTTPGSFFTGSSSYTFTVSAGSQNNRGRLMVSGLVVDVAAGASTGPVSVTIGGTAGASPADIQVATAVGASASPAIDPGFAVLAGQGGSSMVIGVTGVNFAPGATVSIGTLIGGVFTPVPDIVVVPISGTASSLQVGVSVGALVPPGPLAIRVDNGGGNLATLPDAFTVQAAPTVTDTDKKSAAALLQNVPHQLVTITGTGFRSATTAPTQVLFEAGSGITAEPDSVELLSPQVITVYANVSETTPPGTYAVTVVNPDGGVSAPAAGALVAVTNVLPADAAIGAGAPQTTPQPAPPPTPPVISDLAPSSALLGASIMINGSLFGATAATNMVTFAGQNGTRVPAVVSTASAGSLRVTVPTQAVDGPVTVSSKGLLSNGMTFAVANPRLTAVDPPRGARGTVVPLTLTGSKFAAGAIVTISPVTGVILGPPVVDETTIVLDATVASNAPLGLRSVTVRNPDTGTTTLAGAFEVTAPVTGALDLTLAGVPLGTFLPSVQSVALTLDTTGKCTAKTVTPTALALQAQFVSDVVPTPAPPSSITFSLVSSALPGTAINEDCELVSPPANDWSVGTPNPTSQVVTANETSPGSGLYQAVLYSFDMGGTVAITAAATTNPGIKGTLTLPVDTDKDGLPNAYELQHAPTLNAQNGDLNRNLKPDGQDRFVRDGLSNFEKYRGIFAMGPANGTTGLINPAVPDTHQRLAPNRRNLFVRGRGWGNDALMPAGTCGVDPAPNPPTPIPDGSLSLSNPCPPFLIGPAFDQPAVNVKVNNMTASFTAATQFFVKSLVNPAVATLDLLTVFYDGVNCYGSQACDQTTKTGIRQFGFSTLGFSTFGSANAYGSARVFKRAVDSYFRHRPYQHRTNDVARVVIGADGRPLLAPITLVSDKNDNGNKDTGELVDAAGQLLGDTFIPGTVSQSLTAMDVNNDNCVELPFVPDPTKITQDCDPSGSIGTYPQATKVQVGRSVATHEVGHAVGINLHTADPTDLMYQYTINWIRDAFFSPAAANLIQIHNKGLQ